MPEKKKNTGPRKSKQTASADIESRFRDLDRNLLAADKDLRSVRQDMKKCARRLSETNAALLQRRQQLEREAALRGWQLSEKVKRLSILYEVGQALSATLDLDSLLALIVHLAARHLKARKASLMLIEGASGQMRINASVGIRKWIVEKARIKVGEGIAGKVAATGEVILIEDISTDRRFGRPSRGTYRTGSFLSVPLKRQEKILGVLNVSDKKSQEIFDRDDLNLVTTLGAQAAIAVENATLYQRLKEQIATLEEMYRIRDTERQQLLTLINSITDGILAVDTARKPLFINEKAKSLLGLGGEAGGTAGIEDILAPGDLGRGIAAGMDSALATMVNRAEITLTQDGAGRQHLEIISLPLRERQGDLMGALTVIRDITEFKELDQTRSDFLNRASHQLKTPVGLIKGFADTLVKHPELDEARRTHFLKLVHAEADRLADLIESLLDLNRLESKVFRVELERVDLSPFIREILLAVEARAAEKDIKVEASIPAEAVIIETDSTCLREAARNILDNSLKFTPRGGSVSIEVRPTEQEAQLIFTDTGSGIEEADLPWIFDKFYVGRAGTSGTGLGLYIAKEMINALNGSISVSSRTGEGTTVKVTLPLGGGRGERR